MAFSKVPETRPARSVASALIHSDGAALPLTASRMAAAGLVQTGFFLVYLGMLARIYAQLSAGQASVPDVKRAE